MNKKVTCEYTYDEISKALLGNPIAPSYYWLIGIFEFIFGIYVTISWGDGIYKIFGIILIAISLFILGILVYSLPAIREKFLLEKTKKNNEVFKNGIEYIFTFKDNGMKATSILDGKLDTKEYKYSDLLQLSIGKDYFYIFIDKTKVYVCKKNEFSKEELTKLIQIFKNNKVKVVK